MLLKAPSFANAAHPDLLVGPRALVPGCGVLVLHPFSAWLPGRSSRNAGVASVPVWCRALSCRRLRGKRITRAVSGVVVRRLAGGREGTRLSGKARVGAVAIYLPIVGFLTVYHWPWRLFKMDHVLGFATTLLLWVILSAQNRVRETAVWVRVSRSLAGMSYSLYLAHYPMLAFFARWLAPAHWGLKANTLLAVAGFGMLAVLYGYGLAACTEWHNDRVRPWVEEHLRSRSVPMFRGHVRTRARTVAG